MALDYITDRPWALVMASALRGTNVEQVVDWLADKAESA